MEIQYKVIDTRYNCSKLITDTSALSNLSINDTEDINNKYTNNIKSSGPIKILPYTKVRDKDLNHLYLDDEIQIIGEGRYQNVITKIIHRNGCYGVMLPLNLNDIEEIFYTFNDSVFNKEHNSELLDTKLLNVIKLIPEFNKELHVKRICDLISANIINTNNRHIRSNSSEGYSYSFYDVLFINKTNFIGYCGLYLDLLNDLVNIDQSNYNQELFPSLMAYEIKQAIVSIIDKTNIESHLLEDEYIKLLSTYISKYINKWIIKINSLNSELELIDRLIKELQSKIDLFIKINKHKDNSETYDDRILFHIEMELLVKQQKKKLKEMEKLKS